MIALRRALPAVFVPLLLASIATTGCDIVTADLRHEESTEWHKTYQLDQGGRVEIGNVNGKIEVEPSTGSTVDVTAVKKARGATPEAAKAALDRAAGRANGIAAITPERVIREGAAMEQLLAVIDEDPDIAMLVLAANPGAEGPGPLVSLLAHALGTFPVPVTVISGALSDQSVDSLS